MTGFSVLTNPEAASAVLNLNKTLTQLNVTQERINTGLRVSSAKQDASTFTIAMGMRSDVAGFKAIRENLALGRSTVGVALSASESIGDILKDMKQKVTQAGSDNVDRVAVQRDIDQFLNQIKSITQAAHFNGVNLISGDEENIGRSMGVLGSLDRTTGGDLTIDRIFVDYEDLSVVDEDRGLGAIKDLSVTGKVEGEIETAAHDRAQVNNIRFEDMKAGDTLAVTIAGEIVNYTAGADLSAAEVAQEVAAAIDTYRTANSGGALDSALAATADGGIHSADGTLSLLGASTGAGNDFSVTATGNVTVEEVGLQTVNNRPVGGGAVAGDVIALDFATGDLVTALGGSPFTPTTLTLNLFGVSDAISVALDGSETNADVATKVAAAITTYGHPDIASAGAAAGVVTITGAANTAGSGMSENGSVGALEIASLSQAAVAPFQAATSTESEYIQPDVVRFNLSDTSNLKTGDVVQFSAFGGTDNIQVTVTQAMLDDANVLASAVRTAIYADSDAISNAAFDETDQGSITVTEGVLTIYGASNADALAGSGLIDNNLVGDISVHRDTTYDPGQIVSAFKGGELYTAVEAPEDGIADDGSYVNFTFNNVEYAFTFDAEATGSNIGNGDRAFADITALVDAINAPSSAGGIDGLTASLSQGELRLHTTLSGAEVGGFEANFGDSNIDFDALLRRVDDAETVLKAVVGQLGSSSKRLDIQDTYVANLVKSVNDGIGTLVDADMSEESARFQALQVQQQLGLQALSIANAQPQAILSLFNG